MPLLVRSSPYTIPSYSLTGDLLAYLNCGLQYRYHNRASLPPSKPVQLWFGQFIHGVMEESYRTWSNEDHGISVANWGDDQILPIVDLIIRRLAARGLYFQRYRLLGIAIERAFKAINLIGPILFPLINEAEVRLKGIRSLPANTNSIRESNYYEVEGIADVITSVRLSSALTNNPIAAALLSTLQEGDYEIVVDYKGMRRPSLVTSDIDSSTWEYQQWQILTYAWLRGQQSEDAVVKSGLVFYLNELVPGIEDMNRLYNDLFESDVYTDIEPIDEDYELMSNWPDHRENWRLRSAQWENDVQDWWTDIKSREDENEFPPFPRLPNIDSTLSLDYRMRRSWRTIPVDARSIEGSLDNFDRVVAYIEESVAEESSGNKITGVWQANPREETCTVCDFRRFCPADDNRYRGTPLAP
jgi:hypothetical protein